MMPLLTASPMFLNAARRPAAQDLEAALIKGCGQLNLGRLKDNLAADDKLVRVGSEFSTRKFCPRSFT